MRAVSRPADPPGGLDPDAWFARRGWTPFAFQHEVWVAMSAGRSGLLHASTGSGKTYAVWFGALLRGAAISDAAKRREAPRLGVLWLTPMRALAADTVRAISLPLPDLGLAWTIGRRTGDTPSAERAKQDRRFPSALVTTPESLSLMLTRENARAELEGVHTVIGDLLGEGHYLDERVRHCDVHIKAKTKGCTPAQQLMQLMGVGPTTATAIEIGRAHV